MINRGDRSLGTRHQEDFSPPWLESIRPTCEVPLAQIGARNVFDFAEPGLTSQRQHLLRSEEADEGRATRPGSLFRNLEPATLLRSHELQGQEKGHRERGAGRE